MKSGRPQNEFPIRTAFSGRIIKKHHKTARQRAYQTLAAGFFNVVFIFFDNVIIFIDCNPEELQHIPQNSVEEF